MTSQSLQLAYDYCQAVTRAHYENFPVGSLLFPKSIRPAVTAIYAFSRIADDFSDEPEFSQARLEYLDRWEEALLSMDNRTPTHPVFIALRDTVRRFHLPVSLFQDLLHAFRLDLTRVRYETDTELLEYCRYSANPVGRLVLLLAGYRDEALFAYSDHICTALQLANHWQDLSRDVDRSGKNRIYIPQARLRQYGIAQEHVSRRLQSEATAAVIKDLVDWTETLFYQGRPLINALRGRLKWEIALTWWGGMTILEKIRRGHYTTLVERPVLTKRDWAAIGFKTVAGRQCRALAAPAARVDI